MDKGGKRGAPAPHGATADMNKSNTKINETTQPPRHMGRNVLDLAVTLTFDL